MLLSISDPAIAESAKEIAANESGQNLETGIGAYLSSVKESFVASINKIEEVTVNSINQARQNVNALTEKTPEIVIHGVEQRLETNIRAYLSLTKESCAAPKWKIDQLAADSVGQARRALNALGYFQSQIDYHLTWMPDCWRFVLDVEAGKPVRVHDIDIQITGPGADEAFFVDYLGKLPVRRGEVLDQSDYENIKTTLSNIAESKGYFDYQFVRHELLVNPELFQAAFIIRLATGPRYYFGEVNVKQDILNPEFVAKFIYVEQGRPYDQKDISSTFQALDNSGYFQQVQVNYREQQAHDYHAPVNIDMAPLPQHAVSLGVGYDTDLGVRANAEYTNRYINAYGHSFKARINGSQRKSYALLDYKIPFAGKRKKTLRVTAGVTYEDTDFVRSENFNFGVSLSKQYRKEQLLTEQLNFVAERFDSGDGERNFSILLVPGFTWSNIVAEGRGFELHGFKYSYQVQGGTQYLLSDVNFLQHLLNFKIVHDFEWGGRIIGRTALGATMVDDFEDLPTSYRYYAGGNNSVRGYKYQSIGARDAEGDNIGGKYLTVASIEYEQLVYERQWSLVVFVDAGDAFIDRWNPKIGLGIGGRWYSPIGPVSVDVAAPSDDMTDVRFHISFSAAL